LTTKSILEVRSLVTQFSTERGQAPVTAVDRVSFAIGRGRTLGVVGESGSGKSVTSLSIMGLLPSGVGTIAEGEILFEGRDLVSLTQKDLEKIRGNRMAMIFQEPMTALNPVFTAGEQIMEVFQTHRKMSRGESYQASLAMLEKVRIPDPARRMDEYPHQMSGGMKQRIMIAMALACEPALLIADEPTTALDVTIQAQILKLIKDMQKDLGAAVLFITHDLGVIAEMADDVVVMYAGQIVETGTVYEIFDHPLHPYTQGLLRSIPRVDQPRGEPLAAIAGMVPSLKNLPAGCRFAERCPQKQDRCLTQAPVLRDVAGNHQASCHFAGEPHAGRPKP
jgi:oligopeptide/dipeptide ABC transporter ATP-binding protein